MTDRATNLIIAIAAGVLIGLAFIGWQWAQGVRP